MRDRSQKTLGTLFPGRCPVLRLRAHTSPDLCGTLPNRAHTRPGLCVQRPPCFDPVLPSSFYVLRQTQRHVHGSEFSLSELRTTFPTADASMLVRSGKEAARPYLKGDIMRSAWRETTVAERILCAGSLTSGLPDQKGSVFPLSVCVCCLPFFFPRVEHVAYARSSVMRYRD